MCGKISILGVGIDHFPVKFNFSDDAKRVLFGPEGEVDFC